MIMIWVCVSKWVSGRVAKGPYQPAGISGHSQPYDDDDDEDDGDDFDDDNDGEDDDDDAKASSLCCLTPAMFCLVSSLSVSFLSLSAFPRRHTICN